MMEEAKRVTAVLEVTAEFYDPEATPETVRSCVERDLTDAGYEVKVKIFPGSRYVVNEPPIVIFEKKGEWIPVEERMPQERDTMFAKLKGTDKWKPGMFDKMSDDVRVVIRYPDGKRRVHHSYTVDGDWACETLPPYGRKVTHWCENPTLPEEEGKP